MIRPVASITCLAVLLALSMIAPTESRMRLERLQRVEPGTLLVARRSLQDPNFAESVVLMVHHSNRGSLGVIINRPMEVPLREAIDSLPDGHADRHRLHFGGPVLTDVVTYLARSHPAPERSMAFGDGLFYGADPDTLSRLIGDALPPESLRVFAGHSGWAPGQLEAELARDDWFIVRIDADLVFTTAPEALWDAIVDRLDPPPTLAGLDVPGLPGERTGPPMAEPSEPGCLCSAPTTDSLFAAETHP